MDTPPICLDMGAKQNGTRDPDATRQRILQVAREQFSESGFAGTRVDVITRLARVNKQAVYYHFGSKEGLFSAALDSGYEEFRKLDRDLRVSDKPPRQALSDLITANYEYLYRSPQLLAMIMDANRHKGRLLNRKRVRAINAPLVNGISEILARGELAGVFRCGVEPDQLFLSFISLVTFYFTNNYTLSAVLGRNLMKPAEVRRRREHIVDLLLRSVSAG
jgi:TetR/AcrR family transcriptional regulator